MTTRPTPSQSFIGWFTPMQLPALLTSDLHLTANPADDYRWGVFEFLRDQCRIEGVKTLCILGDLTDAKDYHPSSLTNRIVGEIVRLRQMVDQVFILEGNHDYLREGHAYFQFLSHIPGVRFIVEPYEDLSDGRSSLWLPHTKTPMKDWKGFDFSHFNYVFMHQTAPGSVASNGQKMEGDELPDLSSAKVYSGDIHVPQLLGHIEYVGSPYHVHHGDSFKPRCVLLDRNGRPLDLHYSSIHRLSLKVRSIADLKRAKLQHGDQVKITFELSQAEKHEWSRLKREAVAAMAEHGVVLNGLSLKVDGHTQSLAIAATRAASLSDSELVERFVWREDLGGDALDMGLELLR